MHTPLPEISPATPMLPHLRCYRAGATALSSGCSHAARDSVGPFLCGAMPSGGRTHAQASARRRPYRDTLEIR